LQEINETFDDDTVLVKLVKEADLLQILDIVLRMEPVDTKMKLAATEIMLQLTYFDVDMISSLLNNSLIPHF
jgi:hypothetical protein